MVETASPALAVIPLIFACALFAAGAGYAFWWVKRLGRRMSAGQVAWPLVFAAYLVFIAV